MRRMVRLSLRPDRPLVLLLLVLLAAAVLLVDGGYAGAQPLPVPTVEIGLGGSENPAEVGTGLQLLLLLTVLSLAPAILIMMTSFTRIIVVLSFVRNALATQQMPPNQVLIGLALFLTLFVMAPVWQTVYASAWQPYQQGVIDQATALKRAEGPIREFMLANTREKDLALFTEFAGLERPQEPADVPTYLVIPAFGISELKTAFQIGFIIFIPFIVIDMVVASSLMSMGMLMVPPMMVSLPFKILLFIMVDGWHLIIRSIVMGFS